MTEKHPGNHSKNITDNKTKIFENADNDSGVSKQHTLFHFQYQLASLQTVNA